MEDRPVGAPGGCKRVPFIAVIVASDVVCGEEGGGGN